MRVVPVGDPGGVYTADWATDAGRNDITTEQAMRTIADQATIHTPTRPIRDLHPLTTIDDEDLLVTRLGADSIRILYLSRVDGLVRE